MNYLWTLSIEAAEAVYGPAEALNLVRLVVEVVVVGELLATLDWPIGADYDVLLGLHCDDAGRAISITGVVEVASFVSIESRINDILFVQPEEVAITNTLLFVNYFPFIGYFVPDLLTHILDHNILSIQVLMGEKAISMDFAWADFDPLWLGLAQSILHGYRQVALFAHVIWLVALGTPTATSLNTRIGLSNFLLDPILRLS
jgi:hypothetical protein